MRCFWAACPPQQHAVRPAARPLLQALDSLQSKYVSAAQAAAEEASAAVGAAYAALSASIAGEQQQLAAFTAAQAAAAEAALGATQALASALRDQLAAAQAQASLCGGGAPEGCWALLEAERRWLCVGCCCHPFCCLVVECVATAPASSSALPLQAATAQADAASKLAQQSAAVAEFEEAFLARTRAEQAALMEQIGGLLAG